MAAPRHERNPEEIRSEIERTRAEMTGTVEALEKRLSPERLRSVVNRNLRDMTGAAQDRIRDMSGMIIRQMRRRSFPTALLLIGVSWLIIGLTRNKKLKRHEY